MLTATNEYLNPHNGFERSETDDELMLYAVKEIYILKLKKMNRFKPIPDSFWSWNIKQTNKQGHVYYSHDIIESSWGSYMY